MMAESSREVSGYSVTEDAQSELRRWSEKAERELLLRARLCADQRGSAVVTREDVAIAAKGAPSELFGDYLKVKKKTIVRASTVTVGVLVGAFLSWLLLRHVTVPSQGFVVAGLSVLTASISAVVAALGAFYASRAAKAQAVVASREHTRWQVMEAWIEIERAIRNSSAATAGADTAARPIGALIDDHADQYGLGQDFRQDLREILLVRNRIAHGMEFDLSPDKAADLIKRARRIAQRISARSDGSPASTDSL